MKRITFVFALLSLPLSFANAQLVLDADAVPAEARPITAKDAEVEVDLEAREVSAENLTQTREEPGVVAGVGQLQAKGSFFNAREGRPGLLTTQVGAAAQFPVKFKVLGMEYRTLNVAASGAMDTGKGPANGRVDGLSAEVVRVGRTRLGNESFRLKYSSDLDRGVKHEGVAGVAITRGSPVQTASTLSPTIPYRAGHQYRATLAAEGGIAQHDLSKPKDEQLALVLRLQADGTYRYCDPVGEGTQNLICYELGLGAATGSESKGRANANIAYARRLASDASSKNYLFVKAEAEGEVGKTHFGAGKDFGGEEAAGAARAGIVAGGAF